MKHVYIVQSEMSIHEIREKLGKSGADAAVDHAYDVLFLDALDQNLLVKSTAGVDKGQINPIAHQYIDFYRLKGRECPLCADHLSFEESVNRSCSCGFNWNGSVMWIEEEEE